MPVALPDGYSPYKLKLYILERVSLLRNGKEAKQNLIGQGPSSLGDLERMKGWRFTSEQRGYLYRLIQELFDAGYFMPSPGEMNPEIWCVITDAGRAAQSRGALDSFDAALLQVDQGLLERRHGAWGAYHSGGTDSLSQASTSAREFFSQTLRTLAPNDEIQAKSWFVADPSARNSGGVTRAHRIRLAIEKRGLSGTGRELAEAACEVAERWHGQLSGQIHTGVGLAPENVKSAIEAVEAAVKLLLGVP